MKKILSILLIIIMVMSLCVGCSSKSAMNSEGVISGIGGSATNQDLYFGDVIAGMPAQGVENKPSMDYGNETDISPSPDTGEGTENYVEQKIVYSVYTELQTKDLDAALKVLNENIQKYKGYVQSQNQYNNGSIYDKYQRRYVKMTIRIPSENLDAFLSGLENDNMYTLTLNKDSKDYSESYYDKESRINNLKIQEARLLELLEKAADIKTMLDIEERLSNIRYQIETLTKEMNIINSLVNYSTITLNLTEVVKYDEIQDEPTTFLERIKEAVKESWKNFTDDSQDFVVGLIYAFPTLVTLSILIAIIVLIIKKKNKRNKFNNVNTEIQTENKITKNND